MKALTAVFWIEAGILVLVAFSAWWGWRRGLAREAGALAGLFGAGVAGLGAWGYISTSLPSDYPLVERLTALLVGTAVLFVAGYVVARLTAMVAAWGLLRALPAPAQSLGRPCAAALGAARGFVAAAIIHFLATGLSPDPRASTSLAGPLGGLTLAMERALSALAPTSGQERQS